eukprot:365510-Chlamydomonas_euryale.AAC.8
MHALKARVAARGTRWNSQAELLGLLVRRCRCHGSIAGLHVHDFSRHARILCVNAGSDGCGLAFATHASTHQLVRCGQSAHPTTDSQGAMQCLHAKAMTKPFPPHPPSSLSVCLRR